MFLNYFDILISKNDLKNKKYIILIHFQVKNTLNRNNYCTFKHHPRIVETATSIRNLHA